MKKIVFLLPIVLFTSCVFASFRYSATLSAEGKSFAKNQPIILTLQVNDAADEVSMPQLADFNILSEPGNKKTITETLTEGDKTMTRITQTYTLAITPKRTGELTIDAFTFTIDGKQIKTNELIIKVEDRRVSWNDSASVAQIYTGIAIGSETSQGVQTKTAIDYNKPDKTLVQQPVSALGVGFAMFQVQPVKMQYRVKAGSEFIVEYNLYKEAPKAEFTGNIEMAGYENLEGFILVDGPARHLSVKSNATTKVQSGTADLILTAPLQTGTYKLPPMQVMYGETVINSAEIEVVVE
jgi:hypothetical protein